MTETQAEGPESQTPTKPKELTVDGTEAHLRNGRAAVPAYRQLRRMDREG